MAIREGGDKSISTAKRDEIMKKAKFILCASLAIILPIMFLNPPENNFSTVDMEAQQVTETDGQLILEATIQISVYPSESLEALGVDQQQISLNEALSTADVEYRYELGLGTLVSHNSEIILITHDHWSPIDQLGMVQFRNAAGDPLLELDGATFINLIRYQDCGTMILGRSPGGDRSDYLSALVSISQAKYNRRIVPTELGKDESIYEGETLIIVRQGRNGSKAVELMEVSVESIGERWEQLVYKLRSEAGGNIMPGDSGGGLWLGDRFVGNIWKSKYTYGVNWDSLELEQEWTETSYAAGLPDFGDEVIQQIDTVEFIEEVESYTGEQEF
jgi:hypothetical protein